tara:strand:- start:1839 stop:1997 length:159 start_codon:yes stop_codon:yes gene_type:complete
MQELNISDCENVTGGILPAVAFFAKFAAGYVGTFAVSAGFAAGAVEAMSEGK